MGIDFCAIAASHHRFVRIPQSDQLILATSSVSAHHGTFYYVLLYESCKRLGTAIWRKTQSQPSRIDRSLGLFTIGLKRTGILIWHRQPPLYGERLVLHLWCVYVVTRQAPKNHACNGVLVVCITVPALKATSAQQCLHRIIRGLVVMR